MRYEGTGYTSPRWSWEILDCAMPLSFDTYSNCAHQCVYCFAFFQRAIGKAADDYLSHVVKSVSVDRVRRMFTDPDEHAGDFASYIKQRMVLQWGGLSDGFDWYERKLGKSLELLRFFREIDYPVSISTKGVWFLNEPKYVDVIRGATNTHWKYSIITLDEEAAKKLEAGTPSPDSRFAALGRLAALGVGGVTLRFRPFIIGVSDRDIRPMFERARDEGCYSITTEFLCIEKRASTNHRARYAEISKVVGYDVWEYYRRHSYSGSGLMRLNYDLKRPYIEQMRAEAERVGLPFFVSDAHHKEASAGGGCCGLPQDGPLGNWNRGQFSEAMQIAKAQGRVRWSDIAASAEWLKTVSGWKHSNVQTTLDKARSLHSTMYDYMRRIWNTPSSWSSPARYFGGALVPSGLDESGDVVYLYNAPFIEEGRRVRSVDELRLMADLKDRARADGADRGHVAYPIFVLADGAGPSPAFELLAQDQLHATLVVSSAVRAVVEGLYPSAEILASENGDLHAAIEAQVRATGREWWWTIGSDVERFTRDGEEVSPRAALSFVEGSDNPAAANGLVPGAMLRWIE